MILGGSWDVGSRVWDFAVISSGCSNLTKDMGFVSLRL